jgi:hypothetical protein
MVRDEKLIVTWLVKRYFPSLNPILGQMNPIHTVASQ